MERRSFSILGWGLVAAAAAMTVCQLVLMVTLGPAILESGWSDVLLSLGGYIACVGVFYLIVRRQLTGQVQKLPLSAVQLLGFFAVAMGATYIFSLLGSLLDSGLHILINGTDTSYNPVADYIENLNLLTIFISTCALAPVCEELMFRKLLLDRLRPFGDKAAILYSGIAFGLFHINIQQAAYATALGLIFGYLVVRTGNWLHGVALHALVNFTGSVLPTLMDMYPSTAMDTLFAFFMYGVMILAVVLFIIHARRLRIDPPAYQFSVPIRAGVALGNAGTIIYIAAVLGMIAVTIVSAGLV